MILGTSQDFGHYIEVHCHGNSFQKLDHEKPQAVVNSQENNWWFNIIFVALTLLYAPGFFVDINLFKANKERAAEIVRGSQNMVESINENGSTNSEDDLADDDANLMIKLKFLTYKVHVHLLTLCVLLLMY